MARPTPSLGSATERRPGQMRNHPVSRARLAARLHCLMRNHPVLMASAARLLARCETTPFRWPGPLGRRSVNRPGRCLFARSPARTTERRDQSRSAGANLQHPDHPYRPLNAKTPCFEGVALIGGTDSEAQLLKNGGQSSHTQSLLDPVSGRPLLSDSGTAQLRISAELEPPPSPGAVIIVAVTGAEYLAPRDDVLGLERLEAGFKRLITCAEEDGMIRTAIYGHSPNGRGEWHLLANHLEGTAARAAEFGEPLGLSEAAWWAGLWHDLGKGSCTFQDYLAASAEDPLKAKAIFPRRDHKTAGAAWATRHGQIAAAFAIYGHHGGIPSREKL